MKRNLLLGTALCLLALSCQNVTREKMAATANLELTELADSTATSDDDMKPEENKFIRKADIRFKVKDVEGSTYRIESIVRANGGYVSHTHLAAASDRSEKIKVSRDSSLEITYYNVSNNITIRVPNQLLDSTLQEVAREIQFLDHRTIDADDVSIQYLENELGKRRYEGTKAKLLNSAKQKELNATQDISISRKEKADEYFIANKYLDRDVNFSVVNIEIYQRPTAHRELVANEENINAYQPGLLSRIGDSMATGWNILEDLLVLIVRFWGLIALLILGYFLLRKFIAQKKPAINA